MGQYLECISAQTFSSLEPYLPQTLGKMVAGNEGSAVRVSRVPHDFGVRKFEACHHISESLRQVTWSSSGRTRVSLTVVMKLVSPDQRGKTWRWM